jgi:hypothetical protein
MLGRQLVVHVSLDPVGIQPGMELHAPLVALLDDEGEGIKIGIIRSHPLRLR